MVNTKLLPPAHFPTKEALRLWLLKHIEHPSIRRALEKGGIYSCGRFSKIKPSGYPGWVILCESPLGGQYLFAILQYNNFHLKIVSINEDNIDWRRRYPCDSKVLEEAEWQLCLGDVLSAKQLQQRLCPNRRSEEQRPKSNPNSDPNSSSNS